MGYYKTKKRSNGDFMFNLHAGNHQVILTSQGYNSKGGCLNGIESCQKNSGDDGNYERLKSSNDKHYFNLKAGNGQVIGTSEMYESSQGMENGIESCKTNGSSEEIKDET